jgi:hypothetical protein
MSGLDKKDSPARLIRIGGKAIAKMICERFDWCQKNGRLKIVSCLRGR